ncbi:hypothetical protein PR202_ga00371 [Eleusine coracana subsp. coracana]|uniref:Uncharacterized protein n=1 Tax=Eleusine coracana subsp. coracana TaxID=191504 RepID=A0AAV5BG46_ELECO|nr:hypothetical protein PR202_ga00371 [Eleusine coracana subsp. coracana]
MLYQIKQAVRVKKRRHSRESMSRTPSLELTPSSGHGDSEAEIPEEETPATLTSEEHLNIVDDHEGQAIELMRDRPFVHTRHFDPDFLEKIGTTSPNDQPDHGEA